jgi:hypothetical protein
MKNLNLDYPKHIDRALPANMRCGVPDVDIWPNVYGLRKYYSNKWTRLLYSCE